jgi:protein phosphatase PTC6
VLLPNRHGGPQVSQYLHEKLHSIIEEVDKKEIDEVVKFTTGIGMSCRPRHQNQHFFLNRWDGSYGVPGGYFRRFRGGALSRWVGHPDLRPAMTLEERATLAFLTVRTIYIYRLAVFFNTGLTGRADT